MAGEGARPASVIRRPASSPGEPIQPSPVWWDRVEFRLLLREADALILDADFPADPFAH